METSPGGSGDMEPGTASSDAAGPDPVSPEQLSLAALQQLQRLAEWQRLLDTIDQEIKVPIRQVLSHHTSTPCQPGKAAGVTTSLKDSGLEVNVGSPSKAQVRLEIPHLYEMGQGPAWVYRTPEFTTMKAAQQDACKTTLAFLLAMNPEAVHLAPGSLKQGDASVENIRKAAREIRVFGTLWNEARQQVARARPEGKKVTRSVAPVSDRAKETALEALLKLPPGIHRPSHLPRFVWMTLQVELPRGGLRSFLMEYPHVFEVVDNAGSEDFSFERKVDTTSMGTGRATSGTEGADPDASEIRSQCRWCHRYVYLCMNDSESCWAIWRDRR